MDVRWNKSREFAAKSKKRTWNSDCTQSAANPGLRARLLFLMTCSAFVQFYELKNRAIRAILNKVDGRILFSLNFIQTPLVDFILFLFSQMRDS
jgi:hypothetical protein